MKNPLKTLIAWAVDAPKQKANGWLRDRCDAIPQKHRFKLIASLFCAFLLTALLVFGNACYKMGARQERNTRIEVQHMQTLPTIEHEKKSSSYEELMEYLELPQDKLSEYRTTETED